MKQHNKGPFLLIFLLIVIVISSQFILLKPIISQGFTHEDYISFFSVRSMKDKVLADPINSWLKIGLHNASHDFYIGFLDMFFGQNYNMYTYFTIFLKIVGTLLLYPLLLLITKNKYLAFLTTVLYGISYPAAGALYLYAVGNEYLGLIFMNLFLIYYYLCIKTPTGKLLVMSALLLTVCLITSAIRVFPIFLIIIVAELFIQYKNNFSNLRPSMQRLIAFFLPAIIILHKNSANTPEVNLNLTTVSPFLKLILMETGTFYSILFGD